MQKSPNSLTAQQIIDASIKTSGGERLANSTISFDFRETNYKATRANGYFELLRTFEDSTGTVTDVLNNEGFKRVLDEKTIRVSDSMGSLYSASVNSVHYFSVLPFGLNDSSVKKEKLDDLTIKDATYHTVKVTFSAEGGGEDYEDVFLYWIHKDTFKLHYLAYSYNEDDNIGMRFREAYNDRSIEGIHFVDYNNYKSKADTITLMDMPMVFEKGELQLLSKIELKNISVILH